MRKNRAQTGETMLLKLCGYTITLLIKMAQSKEKSHRDKKYHKHSYRSVKKQQEDIPEFNFDGMFDDHMKGLTHDLLGKVELRVTGLNELVKKYQSLTAKDTSSKFGELEDALNVLEAKIIDCGLNTELAATLDTLRKRKWIEGYQQTGTTLNVYMLKRIGPTEIEEFLAKGRSQPTIEKTASVRLLLLKILAKTTRHVKIHEFLSEALKSRNINKIKTQFSLKAIVFGLIDRAYRKWIMTRTVIGDYMALFKQMVVDLYEKIQDKIQTTIGFTALKCFGVVVLAAVLVSISSIGMYKLVKTIYLEVIGGKEIKQEQESEESDDEEEDEETESGKIVLQAGIFDKATEFIKWIGFGFAAATDTMATFSIEDFLKRFSTIASTFTNVERAIVTVWGYLKDILDYFHRKVYGEPYFDVSKVKDELRKHFKILTTAASQDALGTPLSQTDAQAVIDADKYLATCVQKGISSLKDNTIFQEMIQVMLRASGVIGKAYAVVFNQAGRQEPLWIHLVGAPGIGKTVLKTVLLPLLYKLLEGKDYTPADSFDRKVGNEYWDGYNHQWAVVVDDFMQSLEPTHRNVSAYEMICATNTNPYHLHMSSIKDKSTTYFDSKLIITTSNMEAGKYLPTSLQLTDPQAFYRRMAIKMHVTVDDVTASGLGFAELEKRFTFHEIQDVNKRKGTRIKLGGLLDRIRSAWNQKKLSQQMISSLDVNALINDYGKRPPPAPTPPAPPPGGPPPTGPGTQPPDNPPPEPMELPGDSGLLSTASTGTTTTTVRLNEVVKASEQLEIGHAIAITPWNFVITVEKQVIGNAIIYHYKPVMTGMQHEMLIKNAVQDEIISGHWNWTVTQFDEAQNVSVAIDSLHMWKPPGVPPQFLSTICEYKKFMLKRIRAPPGSLYIDTAKNLIISVGNTHAVLFGEIPKDMQCRGKGKSLKEMEEKIWLVQEQERWDETERVANFVEPEEEDIQRIKVVISEVRFETYEQLMQTVKTRVAKSYEFMKNLEARQDDCKLLLLAKTHPDHLAALIQQHKGIAPPPPVYRNWINNISAVTSTALQIVSPRFWLHESQQNVLITTGGSQWRWTKQHGVWVMVHRTGDLLLHLHTLFRDARFMSSPFVNDLVHELDIRGVVNWYGKMTLFYPVNHRHYDQVNSQHRFLTVRQRVFGQWVDYRILPHATYRETMLRAGDEEEVLIFPRRYSEFEENSFVKYYGAQFSAQSYAVQPHSIWLRVALSAICGMTATAGISLVVYAAVKALVIAFFHAYIVFVIGKKGKKADAKMNKMQSWDPKHDKKTNKQLRKVPAARPPIMQSNPNLPTIVSKMYSNIEYVEFWKDDKMMGLAFMLFVKGSTAVVAGHCMAGGITKLKLRWARSANSGTVTILREQWEQRFVEGRDLAILTFLPGILPPYKKITQHMWPTEPKQSEMDAPVKVDFAATGTMLMMRGHSVTKYNKFTCVGPNGSLVHVAEAWKVTGVSGVNGDCGLPYFIDSTTQEGTLLGIHMAATDGATFVVPLYQSDFPEEIKMQMYMSTPEESFPKEAGYTINPNTEYLIEGLKTVGNLMQNGKLKTLFMPGDSVLRQSVVTRVNEDFHGEIKHNFTTDKKPARLKPFMKEGELISPLKKACERFAQRNVPPMPAGMKDKKFLKGIFHDNFKWELVRPLTWHEVINGADGTRSVHGIDMSSSSGPSLAENGITLEDMFPGEPGNRSMSKEVTEELERRAQMRRNGEMPYMVSQQLLKDELRTAGKEDKPRIFSSADKYHFLEAKRVLAMLFEQGISHSGEGDIYVGINPHGPEWQALARKLANKSTTRIIADDIEAWDMNMRQWFISIILDYILDNLHRSKWTEDDILMLISVLTTCENPLVIIGYVVLNGLLESSGWFGTANWNSWYNSWATRFLFSVQFPDLHFDDWIAQGVFGDDLIQSVLAGLPGYNGQVLAKLRKDYFGINTTSILKDGSDVQEFVPLFVTDWTPGSAQFLKRQFKLDGVHIYPILDPESITGMICWYKKNKEIPEWKSQVQNFETALRELVYYGKDKFETSKTILQRYAQVLRRNYHIDLEYDDLIKKYY